MKLTRLDTFKFSPTALLTIESINDKQVNCQMNNRLCRPWFIPFTTFDEMYFFVPIGAGPLPTAVNYTIFGNCVPFVPFPPITVTDYVISKDEDQNTYLVFKIPANYIPPIDVFTIIVDVVFVNFVTDHVFFATQQFKKEKCENVTLVKTCFKPDFSKNVDCNGVYFGTFNDEGQSVGNLNLAYKHNYYVRSLNIKESKKTITFNSNSKFKSNSEVSRLKSLIIADEMQSFYMDYVQLVFSLGTVNIGSDISNFNYGTNYNLSEVDISSLNECCNTFLLKSMTEERCDLAIPCTINTNCPTCVQPFITVRSNSSTTIELEVIDGYISTETYDYTIDGGLTWLPLTSNPLTITGLSPTGFYNVQVRHNCTPESSFSNSVSLSTLVCSIPIVSVQNVKYYSFEVFINNFQIGDTYDISIDGGATYTVIGATTQTTSISAASSTPYQIVVKHNCISGEFGISSPLNITTGSPIYCISLGNTIHLSGGNGITTGTFQTTFTLKDQYGNTIINTTGSAITFDFAVTNNGVTTHTFLAIANGSSFFNAIYTLTQESDFYCIGCNFGTFQNGTMAHPYFCNTDNCQCNNCLKLTWDNIGSTVTVELFDCCNNSTNAPQNIQIIVEANCSGISTQSIMVIPSGSSSITEPICNTLFTPIIVSNSMNLPNC